MATHTRADGPRYLDAAPLLELMERRARERDVSIWEIAADLGVKLDRVIKTGVVTTRGADVWTIRLGSHPLDLWGPDWDALAYCKNGHEWTEENTYVDRGRSQCRACGAARARARKQRQRDEVAA